MQEQNILSVIKFITASKTTLKQLPAMLFECKMKIFKYMIFITLLITGSFSTAAPQTEP
jgi:hypothetical protein